MPITRDPIPFHDQMRILRAVAGLTQRRLSHRAGVSLSKIVAFENQYEIPTAEEKQKIFVALSTGDDE